MEKSVLGPSNTPITKSKPISSDEKAPDSSDINTPLKKISKPKSKKKKKMNKDSLDPQKPLNAYNWFIRENREKIRAENPSWNFTEITKKLAQDWRALTAEQKQQYTETAEIDKERYARELSVYKQSEAYKSFTKNQKNKDQNKKLKDSSHNVVTDEFNQDKEDGTGLDIPIFTEEFLDHNKLREAELRQLRKSNTDYEQQNSILEKLIENTKTAITKLEKETVQQRCHNQALQQHLDQMRVTLTNAFQDISLPDEEKPTLQTIDSYVVKLHALLLNQNVDSPLYIKVKEVVQQLDLDG